jgi:hypothetical protein
MCPSTLEPIEFFVRELNADPEFHLDALSSCDSGEKVAETRPWENAHPKMKVLFQARLPDRLHKKLQWVSQHAIGSQSMQELLLIGVERYLDERIDEIEGRLRRE